MGVKVCACGAKFVSKASNAKRCPGCRAGNRQAVLPAIRSELDAIGKAETGLGSVALGLAARLDAGTDPGSAMAAMAKELRSCMAELTRNAPAKADPVDELRKRREARQRGA